MMTRTARRTMDNGTMTRTTTIGQWTTDQEDGQQENSRADDGGHQTVVKKAGKDGGQQGG